MSHREVLTKETIQPGFYGLGKQASAPSLFSQDIKRLLSDWREGQEGVLIVAPHDDDATIGMGMLIRHIAEARIPLTLAIVTDGRLGYTSLADRAVISEIRQKETVESCSILGMDSSQIQWLGFPDGDLERYRGRRCAGPEDPSSPDGFTGLEDALVRLMRRGIVSDGVSVPITRVFFPPVSDYHNDHIVVAEQMLISLFHAQGSIWPECGSPLSRGPHCYQFAIYCDFAPDQAPNILFRGTEEDFHAKMRSIMAFRSQGQIATIIEGLQKEGPFELFREVEFRLASRDRQLVTFLNRRYKELC